MKRQTRILRQTVRQVRLWVLGFCAVCLPGMVALAAEVSVAEVLQAWQARQARVESLRYEFVGDNLFADFPGCSNSRSLFFDEAFVRFSYMTSPSAN